MKVSRLLVPPSFFSYLEDSSPRSGNVARAETKFRDLNFDQSLYLLAATSFPILFYALYTLAVGTRTRVFRGSIGSRVEGCVILCRDHRKSGSKSSVKLHGVTNARHRGIFIESGARENQFSTDRRRFQTSRTLAVFHYPLVMTVVPYRAVITAPILDNPSVFPSGGKKCLISHRVFFFLPFLLISTATPVRLQRYRESLRKKERRNSLRRKRFRKKRKGGEKKKKEKKVEESLEREN